MFLSKGRKNNKSGPVFLNDVRPSEAHEKHREPRERIRFEKGVGCTLKQPRRPNLLMINILILGVGRQDKHRNDKS